MGAELEDTSEGAIELGGTNGLAAALKVKLLAFGFKLYVYEGIWNN